MVEPCSRGCEVLAVCRGQGRCNLTDVELDVASAAINNGRVPDFCTVDNIVKPAGAPTDGFLVALNTGATNTMKAAVVSGGSDCSS